MEKLVAWKFIVQWFGRRWKLRGQNGEMNAEKKYAIKAYVLLNHHVVCVDTKFNLPNVSSAALTRLHTVPHSLRP